MCSVAAVLQVAFADFLVASVKKWEHDVKKAFEVIGQAWDTAFVAKIAQLEAINGGADQGKSWWEGAGDNLEPHFAKTLEKVNVQFIVDKTQSPV